MPVVLDTVSATIWATKIRKTVTVTADQMAALTALDAATDAAFESAATAAGSAPDPNATT